MNQLTVEYLLLVETTNSFLNNKLALSNLLMTSTDIQIEERELTFEGQIYKYEVFTEKLNEKERYFHMVLTSLSTTEVDQFNKLLRVIKSLLAKASNDPLVTLWDDISFLYANKAYPLIHHIENLMRKLITIFMFVKVDRGWTRKFVPDKVKASMRSSNGQDRGDYLYQTDFIQLANFLFHEYKSSNTEKLFREINNASVLEELDLNKLKEYVPKSNWERYFSDHVNCSLTYLEKKWKRLYELRCKIAHNNTLSQSEYYEIEKLVEDLSGILQLAIDKIKNVELSDLDKESIVENVNTVDVYANYYDNTIRAKFNLDDELIYYKGEALSPSKAATKAKLDHGAATESSTNGWRFWRYFDKSEDCEKFITDLRVF